MGGTAVMPGQFLSFEVLARWLRNGSDNCRGDGDILGQSDLRSGPIAATERQQILRTVPVIPTVPMAC